VAERAEKNAGLVRLKERGRATDANRGGGDHGLTIPESETEAAIGSSCNSLPFLRFPQVFSRFRQSPDGDQEELSAKPSRKSTGAELDKSDQERSHAGI
jgi:hypothetical protein